MAPRIAFLFTGQGAQYAHMGRQLYRTLPRFRTALDHVASRLDPHLPRRILEVVFEGGELQQAQFAQPALFALQVALLEVLKGWGVAPSVVMGHDVGEIAAAFAAGALDLESAALLVTTRARLTQQQPAGKMLAASLPENRALELLAPHAKTAAIAAVDGPQSTVFSGAPETIDAIKRELDRLDVRSQELAVSHASNSPLMDSMLGPFKAAVQHLSIRPTSIELIAGLTGQVTGVGATLDVEYWTRQARDTVRYLDGAKELNRTTPTSVVEVGPHPTLIGALENYWDGDRAALTPTLRRETEEWAQLAAAATALQARGIAVDWTAFYSDYREYSTRQASDAVGLITRSVPDPRHALGIDKAAYDLVESSKDALRGSTFELVSFGFDKDRHYLWGIRGPTGVRYLFFDWYNGGTMWLAPTPWAEATRVMQRVLAYDNEARAFKSVDGQTPQAEAFVRGLQDAFAAASR